MRSTPDAILLCGGAGLRLRSVIGQAPKGMADIGGRPFLELLLRQLSRNGFRRVILAVGYQQERIRSHFGDRAFGLHLVYSAESFPLGTGGALRNAADQIESETALIMNGDSYTDVDLCELVASHRSAKADVTVTVVRPDGRADCGSVLVEDDGKLTSFHEKQSGFSAPYINAGIYAVARQILYEIPEHMAVSLELELLPTWLRERKSIRGFVSEAQCLDIGTPERYGTAQDILATAEVAIGRMPNGGSL